MTLLPCVFSPVSSPIVARLKKANPHWNFVETSKENSFASLLCAHFIAQKPIIMIGAIAIAVRILAPHIRHKQTEPPVVVISPDAKHIVPILGGHHGANDLASELANLLDAQNVISNTSCIKEDTLASIPHSWVVANAQKFDTLRKAMFADLRVHSHCFVAQLPFVSAEKEPHITLTDRKLSAQVHADSVVIYPPTLTLGMGFVRNGDPCIIADFVETTLEQHQIAQQSVAGIATVALKRFEPALHEVARRLDIPVRIFDASTLEQVHKDYDLADNPTVYNAVGVHSVADASALALASTNTSTNTQTGAHLIVKKQIHPLATLAIASASVPLSHNHVASKGSACGVLHVIGTGPGDAKFLTNDAIHALHDCSVIVGYSLYIDLIKPYLTGKTNHAFPLGKERDRVVKALSCVEEGHSVGLVCSGDPGIYAMATLVFEEIEHRKKTLPVVVHPGISAMVMASSKFGAILGHDFCAISLSDLLTPRATIIERITHAAKGDFVIAFYNPQSLERRALLKIALDIIKEHRPPSTPVAIARNLTRNGEHLSVTPLSDFCHESVDMLSIMLVGNSQSRTLENVPLTFPAVYTPRGYY